MKKLDISKIKNTSKKYGFTLIELSIVLVIVSILIVAVGSGKSLIKQAKLRNIITEADDFNSSVSAFSNMYGSLPGDMPNAFNVWGTSCASSATSCNGNGDGHIVHTSGTTGVESFLAWEHLQLAGMIKGTYTGTTTVAGQANLGVNVPVSNYSSNSGWGFNYLGVYSTPTYEGQYIEIGGFKASNAPTTPILPPVDAYNIDLKIDDGLPRSGIVFGYGAASSTGCYASDNSAYNTLLPNSLCTLRFTIKKY